MAGYAKQRANWQDFPVTATPILASNLNALEQAIFDLKKVTLYVNDYGAAAGASAATNDSAILAALADVPTYTGGIGGVELVFADKGTYSISATITAWTSARQGLTIRGTGSHSTVIRGTIAGPLLTNDSGTQEIYNRLEGLYLLNDSANVAARAIQTNNMNELVLRDCTFESNTTGSGSCSAQLDLTYDLLVENCAFGGSSADHCLKGSTQNVATYLRNSFRNAKSGMNINSGAGINIVGCSFQALAGAPTDGVSGCINLSSGQGGTITGNYHEGCNCSFLKGNSTFHSHGFVVGGNFVTNFATPAIDMTGFDQCVFMPNHYIPGAFAANGNGLAGAPSANATGNVVMPQYLASGSGSAQPVETLSTTTATTKTVLANAGITSGTYTVATRPANVAAGTMIYVSDGGAGAVFQGWNGAAWVNLG